MLFSLLLISLCAARGPLHPQVFGIYTDFGPGDKRTIVQLGEVNMTTGEVDQLQTLFVYEGGSGTFDGISAFDQDNGRFFYSNDFANSYVFGVGVQPPYPLRAPIWLEDNGVASISYDWKDKQLLISDIITQPPQNRLVIYPNSPDKSTTVITLSNFSLGAGCFDSEKKQWFNLATVGANSSILTTVALPSGNVVSSVSVDCGILSKIWVEAKHPDFDSRLWGLKELQTRSSLSYYLANINPSTGSCELLKIPSSGIVTAASFDQHNGVLFYHDATNSGNFVRSASVRTGRTSFVKLVSQFPLSDLAVRFLN